MPVLATRIRFRYPYRRKLKQISCKEVFYHSKSTDSIDIHSPLFLLPTELSLPRERTVCIGRAISRVRCRLWKMRFVDKNGETRIDRIKTTLPLTLACRSSYPTRNLQRVSSPHGSLSSFFTGGGESLLLLHGRPSAPLPLQL